MANHSVRSLIVIVLDAFKFLFRRRALLRRPNRLFATGGAKLDPDAFLSQGQGSGRKVNPNRSLELSGSRNSDCL